MDITLFDYDLPPELIAQRPRETRSGSRMMTLNRRTGETLDRNFSDFANCLNTGDCLVLNDTRVFPARLTGGKRNSGGAVEVFLLRPISDNLSHVSIDNLTELNWRALVRPSARVNEGESISFALGAAAVETVELRKHLGEGVWEIAFSSSKSASRIVGKFGSAPIPPYINRPTDSADTERYQTVYANPQREGAVAAPTAGLHFSEETLENLRLRGIKIVYLTLHVGPGTFKPVTVTDTDKHIVDPEWAEISAETAKAINDAVEEGRSIVAVGTTVTRALEFSARLPKQTRSQRITPFRGMVDLFIQPGYEFQVVDELLTNFHLPKSSLLLLVSAFAGRELILKRYAQAAADEYRFYSYGDCMFIHTRESLKF